MKVTLIDSSHDNIDKMYIALSQCYNEHFDQDSCERVSQEMKENVILKILKSGHDSVSEHITFTFLIEDVSRVLTHQLVRHRIASYSQRSARYTKVNTETCWYVVPDGIKTPEQLEIYKEIMDQEAQAYEKLIAHGVKKEDARYILGDAQKTNIVVTMNCRSLKNFFGERLCTRAQKEIRELATEMSGIMKEKFPVVFRKAKFGDPKCIQDGFCREAKSCGKIPHISQFVVIEKIQYEGVS